MYTACNYVLSGFTPNGDKLNDVLTPLLTGDRVLNNFSIYNRRGNLFVWLLQYQDRDGKLVIEKGTVTLIR